MRYVIPIWLIFLTIISLANFFGTEINSHTPINSAQFAPNSEGFQSVDTDIGKLTVSLQKIEKYANGHKIFLQIGNPTSATLSDTEITVKYGVNFENSDKIFSDWYNNLKESKKNITQKLMPSTWNNVEVTLSPSTDEETGFISVELNPKKISLKTK